MLIAFLFTYLISVIAGGETAPFLLVDNKKVVRQFVEDDERKEHIYAILDDAKDQHKDINKATKKISKKLNELAKDRGALLEDFKEQAKQSYSYRVMMQEVNLLALVHCRENITEKEWAQMSEAFFEENKKISKLINKRVKQVEKGFDKTEKKFRNVIADEENADAAIGAMRAFESSLNYMVEDYVGYMLNEESIIYQYAVSEEIAKTVQKRHIDNLSKVFDALLDLHFVLVENSTEKEWKRINSKLKLPY